MEDLFWPSPRPFNAVRLNKAENSMRVYATMGKKIHCKLFRLVSQTEFSNFSTCPPCGGAVIGFFGKIPNASMPAIFLSAGIRSMAVLKVKTKEVENYCIFGPLRNPHRVTIWGGGFLVASGIIGEKVDLSLAVTPAEASRGVIDCSECRLSRRRPHYG